jgi:hypothetical protein
MTKYSSIGMAVLLVLALALTAAAQNPLALTAGSASGSLSATGSVTLPVNALNGSAAWQLTGTFSGTVTFEATVDGTNWVAAAVVPIGATRTLTTTATAAGLWQQNVSGLAAVRVRVSTYTSGTFVITGKRSSGTAPVQ